MKRTTRRSSTMIAAGVTTAMLLAGCTTSTSPGGGDDGGSQEAQVLLTTSTWNIAYAPFVVASELGYFDDIEVEYVLLQGSATVYQQLSQEHGDMAVLSPEPVVIGKDKGENMDLTYFSSYYRESIWGVAVPSGSPVETVDDLEGNTVGVASIESGGVYAAKAVLKDAGIDPDLGVKYLAIGSGPQAVTAVQGNNVEALSLFDSQYASLENAGIELTMLDTPKLSSLTSGGFVAKSNRLDEDPDLFATVARGIAKASLFTATNPEAAVHIMWKVYPETKPQGVSDEEAMASAVRMLDARMDNVKLKSSDDRWGEMTEQEWSDFVDFTKDAGMVAGDVDATSMFTTDLVDHINDFDSAEIEEQAREYSVE